ncbi:DUF6541 family protein [Arthrobacter sp.]|uniref:DUF6541 family protein n=1 Tax=Arthrobacter sp. TaxID=1667 RepID=UPI0026E08903|nr:DUF6541 family protein [Arthrobacter sp.]MDO5751464.1 hypothetical protein [Arthrobacter sp.]
MTWLDTAPTILAAALIIFVPGALLAWAFGLRGLAWIAAAAPLTVTLVSVGTIAAGIVHLGWSPVVLGVFSLGACAVAWGGRKLVLARFGSKRETIPPRPTAAIVLAGLGGLVFGSGVIALRLLRMFIAPANISQTYDNVHHLTAIRAILESGNGSALSVGSMVQNGPAGIYPYAWHNLVALTVQVSDARLPVAVNSVNIVIGALVWTVAAMFLASRVAGTRPAVLLLAGAVAGSFGAFPFLALGWGVLYPNFLGIALLPVFIGLVGEGLKLSPAPRMHPALCLTILVIGLPGLAMAHPNIVMALGAFTIPLLVFWLVRLLAGRRISRWGTGAALLAVVLYMALFVVLWDRLRPSVAGSHWPPTLTLPVAAAEALAVSPLQVPLSWPVFILMLLGILAVCIQRRRIWALGTFMVGAMFFVVVSSFPATALRQAVTGVFFNDSNRLAALLPVVALPLMVTGAVWVFDLAQQRIPAGALQRSSLRTAVAAAGVLAAVLVGVAAQNNAVGVTERDTSEYYVSNADSWLLSSDEAALLRRVPEEIPAGATVIGHPANGGSLVYALEGIKTVVPSLSSVQSPQIKTVFAHLQEIDVNPAVCDAIRSLNAYYFLDFGSGRQVSDMRMTIPSSEDLAVTPGLTLIDEEGPAKLYRIDACH